MRKGFARSIAVAIIGGLLLASASGCTALNVASNSDTEQQVVSEISPDIETQWEEAKEASKKQIIDWYKANVASDETIKQLWSHFGNRDKKTALPFSYFVLKNHIPKYSVKYGFFEIPNMITSYFSMLDKVDPKGFMGTEEIEKIILNSQKQCGLILTKNGNSIDLSFDNIPTFNEEQENNSKEIYIVTDGDIAFYSTNYNIYEEATNYQEWLLYEGEFVVSNMLDTSVKVNASNSLLSDAIIFWCRFYDSWDGIRVTVNGEIVEPERIEINDILSECYFLFADNEEYVSICNERGIAPDN